MQISKEVFDEMEGMIQSLKEEVAEDQETRLQLRAQLSTFDEILEKITRAADGWPLINARNGNVAGYDNVGMSRYERPHRCVPFTPEELRQGELEALREQSMMFAERLAAVKAVAQFAKEHKA